jgi:hypothetical protein
MLHGTSIVSAAGPRYRYPLGCLRKWGRHVPLSSVENLCPLLWAGSVGGSKQAVLINEKHFTSRNINSYLDSDRHRSDHKPKRDPFGGIRVCCTLLVECCTLRLCLHYQRYWSTWTTRGSGPCRKGTFFWRHQDVLHPMTEHSNTPQRGTPVPLEYYTGYPLSGKKHMGDNAKWRSLQCDSGSAIWSHTPVTQSYLPTGQHRRQRSPQTRFSARS